MQLLRVHPASPVVAWLGVNFGRRPTTGLFHRRQPCRRNAGSTNTSVSRTKTRSRTSTMLARRLAWRARAFPVPRWRRWYSDESPEHPIDPEFAKAPPNEPKGLPTVPNCPEPRCKCAQMPRMPEGFEIDHDTPLRGLIPSFDEQVVICTGKDDWPSRIDDDNDGDNLAADLKRLIGPGKPLNNSIHRVSVLNSSLPPSAPQQEGVENASAFLLPSFLYLPHLPRGSSTIVEAMAKCYLLPEVALIRKMNLTPPVTERFGRKELYGNLLSRALPVREFLVLICGHGGRDPRCGILGPLLRAEFEARLPARGVEVLSEPLERHVDKLDGQDDAPEEPREHRARMTPARVGVTSHMGGHSFAGNVMIYAPPNAVTITGRAHPLAGLGVWYGRVEPRHVDGIVAETILQGNVIEELLRGEIRPREDV